jgi:hypothetical protein
MKIAKKALGNDALLRTEMFKTVNLDAGLVAVGFDKEPEAPAELVADKGYHSRETLKALDDGSWKTRIAEPKRDGFLRWHGNEVVRPRS